MLYVVLDHPAARLPTKGSENAAGFDVTAVESAVIPPGERAIISTGLRITTPAGAYGRLAPRSGLAAKHGIDVLAGVIDADYGGIVSVVLLNTGRDAFRVTCGDRIAQLIMETYAENTKICACESLPRIYGRGSGGFGSTGA